VANDVEMAIGDRIERPGIEGASRHGAGLAREFRPRKGDTPSLP
jgi:hypothetical protein